MFGPETLFLAIPLLIVVTLSGGAFVGLSQRDLRRELKAWREGGLISADQAAAIQTRHAEVIQRERRDRLATILGILGAVVVALGVILFYAANWSEISRWVRLVALVSGIATLYFIGYVLRERRGHQNIGHGFIFLAAMLFGAALFLVDQMYHVQAHDPLAFLWWTIAAAGVGLVIRSAPIIALALLTFFAWLVYELVDLGYEEVNVLYFPALLGLYGLALYAAGTGAEPWLSRVNAARAMRVVGFAIALLILFGLSFRYGYGQEGGERPSGFALYLLTAFACAVAAGVAFLAIRRRRVGTFVEAALIMVSGVLMLLIVFKPEVGGGQDFEDFSSGAKLYPLLFNALLALVVLGSMFLGFIRDEVWLANGGVGYASLLVLARFVDFEAWSMLSRSLVFMASGLVVVGLAYALERGSLPLEERGE